MVILCLVGTEVYMGWGELERMERWEGEENDLVVGL